MASLSGWTLYIDTDEYDIPTPGQAAEPPETPDPRIELVELSGGLTAARRLVFREKPKRHDDPSWGKNTLVRLKYVDEGDTTHWMFYGWIETPMSVGAPGEEYIEYECLGPKSRLNKVFWIHDGLARVCWNLTDVDDEDYDEAHVDQDIYHIVWQMLTDTTAADDLEDVAGITSWYLDPSMSADSPTPENISFNAPTGALDIIDQMIRWLPGYVCYVLPGETGCQLLIRKTANLTSIVNEVLGGKVWVPSNRIAPTSAGSYGALEIYGKRGQVDRAWYWDPDDTSGSDLEPVWSPSYEGVWTPQTRNDSEELRAVFRRWKAKASIVARWANIGVRITPNTEVKVFCTKQVFTGGPTPSVVWMPFTLRDYNPNDRTFELSAPAYVSDLAGGWESSELVLRNVVLSDAVTVRLPEIGGGAGGSDFDGDAYTIDGTETVWKKYSEKLRSITMTGTSTDSGLVSGRLIDVHAGVRAQQLQGCTIEFLSGTYTISSHQTDFFETDYVGNIPAGTDYTITGIDTSGDFEEILEALFPSLTAVSFPVKQTLELAARSISYFNNPFKLRIFADDGHTTNWEALDVILTNWDYSFQSNSLDFGCDSESSFAMRSYEDLVAAIDIENRLEEVEIWIQRNEKSTDTVVEGGTSENTSDIATGAHDHDSNNPEELHEENTKMTDGTNVGPIAVTYDPETEEFQAQWKTGPFS